MVLGKNDKRDHARLSTCRKHEDAMYVACSNAQFTRHPDKFKADTEQTTSSRNRISSMEVKLQDLAWRARPTSITLRGGYYHPKVCLFFTLNCRNMLEEEALLLQEINWRMFVAARREADLQVEEVERATTLATRKKN